MLVKQRTGFNPVIKRMEAEFSVSTSPGHTGAVTLQSFPSADLPDSSARASLKIKFALKGHRISGDYLCINYFHKQVMTPER